LNAARQGREVAAFVLAGGQSSRMGRDKALVELAGQPLIAHALGVLRGAGLEPKIAGARTDLQSYAPVIADTAQDRGPLAGICAALASTSWERTVFLSVDLPLIPSSLIEFLIQHAEISGQLITLAAVNGFPQTFPSVVHREALPALRNELDTDRRGCLSAFRAASTHGCRILQPIAAELLAQTGSVIHPAALPPGFWFLNVNTAADSWPACV
jgi:molybdopterin-guanine dinucleotide biosynthesis protein A